MKKKKVNNEIDIIDILNLLIKFKKIIIINLTLCLLVSLIIFFTINYKKKFRITLSLNEPAESVFSNYYYLDLYKQENKLNLDIQNLEKKENYKNIFLNFFSDNLLSKKNFKTFLLSYEFDNKSKILEFNSDLISHNKNTYYIEYLDKSLDLSKLILDYVLFSKNKSIQQLKFIINEDLNYEIYKIRSSIEIARDINLKYPIILRNDSEIEFDNSNAKYYFPHNKDLDLYYSGEIILTGKLKHLEKILTNLINENFEYNLIHSEPKSYISPKKNDLLIYLLLALIFGFIFSTMQILITESSKKKIKKS